MSPFLETRALANWRSKPCSNERGFLFYFLPQRNAKVRRKVRKELKCVTLGKNIFTTFIKVKGEATL
jgi:hypothetical protein